MSSKFRTAVLVLAVISLTIAIPLLIDVNIRINRLSERIVLEEERIREIISIAGSILRKMEEESQEEWQ